MVHKHTKKGNNNPGKRKTTNAASKPTKKICPNDNPSENTEKTALTTSAPIETNLNNNLQQKKENVAPTSKDKYSQVGPIFNSQSEYPIFGEFEEGPFEPISSGNPIRQSIVPPEQNEPIEHMKQIGSIEPLEPMESLEPYVPALSISSGETIEPIAPNDIPDDGNQDFTFEPHSDYSDLSVLASDEFVDFWDSDLLPSKHNGKSKPNSYYIGIHFCFQEQGNPNSRYFTIRKPSDIYYLIFPFQWVPCKVNNAIGSIEGYCAGGTKKINGKFTLLNDNLKLYINNQIIITTECIFNSGDFLYFQYENTVWCGSVILSISSLDGISTKLRKCVRNYFGIKLSNKKKTNNYFSNKDSHMKDRYPFKRIIKKEAEVVSQILSRYTKTLANFVYTRENMNPSEDFPYPIDQQYISHLTQLIQSFLFDSVKRKSLLSLNAVSRFIKLNLPRYSENVIELLLRRISTQLNCRLVIFDCELLNYTNIDEKEDFVLNLLTIQESREIKQIFENSTPKYFIRLRSNFTLNLPDSRIFLGRTEGPVNDYFFSHLPPNKTEGFVTTTTSNTNNLVNVMMPVTNTSNPSSKIYGYFTLPISFLEQNHTVNYKDLNDLILFESFIEFTTGIKLLPISKSIISRSESKFVDYDSDNDKNMTLSDKKFDITSRETVEPTIVFMKNIDAFTPKSRLDTLINFFQALPDDINTIFLASESNIPVSKTNSRNKMNEFSLFNDEVIENFKNYNSKFKRKSKYQTLFKYEFTLNPPIGGESLSEWKRLVEHDQEQIIMEKNLRKIKTLQINLDQKPKDISFLKTNIFTPDQLRSVFSLNVLSTLNSNGSPDTLIQSYNQYTTIFNSDNNIANKLANIQCENDIERSLLNCVILPKDIGIKFSDIGSLKEIKNLLYENVTLPLVRNELFRKGLLRNPCRGILLFGPPGTGKTMLAKAVATEAGACFLNVSVATINSKWFGDAEKSAKYIFTLARKLSPCVIFIDEIDSLLGKRSNHHEHESSRKVKNEFMSSWDGLKNLNTERVIVLGCTNRPYDLDDAVLRRFPRRVFVDLPKKDERAEIFKKILADDVLLDINFQELAGDEISGGFSGSDIKTLCEAAAYEPLRDFLAEENQVMKENPQYQTNKDKKLRPIEMKDFIVARKKVTSTYNQQSASHDELKSWNEAFGDGTKSDGFELTYFI